MNDTKWHLFTIGGHPVYMTPTFLLIMVVFVFANVRTSADILPELLWAPVLFFGILWHELGHAMASKALGFGRSTIMFWGLGGLAINEYQGRRAPWKSVVVSLAGPFASLLLGLAGGVALYAYSDGLTAVDLLGRFFWLTLTANMFWAIFNLLPIYPMDGGQALLSTVEGVTKKPKRSATITGYVGIAAIVLAFGAAFLWGVNLGVFTLLLGGYFGFLNWKLTQSGRVQGWVG